MSRRTNRTSALNTTVVYDNRTSRHDDKKLEAVVAYFLFCILSTVVVSLVMAGIYQNCFKRRRGFLHVRAEPNSTIISNKSSYEITPVVIRTHQRKTGDSRQILEPSPTETDLEFPEISNLTIDWPTPLQYRNIDTRPPPPRAASVSVDQLTLNANSLTCILSEDKTLSTDNYYKPDNNFSEHAAMEKKTREIIPDEQ